MSEGPDRRIGDLLRQDAPPARDPAFRVSVLERREQKRFLRQTAILGLIALALAVIALVGIAVGGDTAVTAIVLMLAVVLVAAYTFYAPAVNRIMQRLGF
jgi:hypothetical protein